MTIYCSADSFHSAPTTTRVCLSHGRFENRRGQTYNVHLGAPEGELIAANVFDPEYAACRALMARGVAGRLEVWRPGSAFPAMVVCDSAKGARLTIREDAQRGPCTVKYRPRFEPDEVIEEEAGLPAEVAVA